jgi:hypothetical protein
VLTRQALLRACQGDRVPECVTAGRGKVFYRVSRTGASGTADVEGCLDPSVEADGQPGRELEQREGKKGNSLPTLTTGVLLNPLRSFASGLRIPQGNVSQGANNVK